MKRADIKKENGDMVIGKSQETVKWRKAATEEYDTLTEMQNAAFAKYADLELPTVLSTPSELVRRGCDIWAILQGERIIGGVFIKSIKRAEYSLHRIFIDGNMQRKGLGLVAIQEIESLYPDIKRLKVETPRVLKNNIGFYKKAGFVKTGYIWRRNPNFKTVFYVCLVKKYKKQHKENIR
jgi:GNAT superfamily N-acetyltransferase